MASQPMLNDLQHSNFFEWLIRQATGRGAPQIGEAASGEIQSDSGSTQSNPLQTIFDYLLNPNYNFTGVPVWNDKKSIPENLKGTGAHLLDGQLVDKNGLAIDAAGNRIEKFQGDWMPVDQYGNPIDPLTGDPIRWNEQTQQWNTMAGGAASGRPAEIEGMRAMQRYREQQGEQLGAELESRLQGFGAGHAKDIENSYRQLAASQGQNLISRGMYGTSAANTLEAQNEAAKQDAMNQMWEGIDAAKTGVLSDIGKFNLSNANAGDQLYNAALNAMNAGGTAMGADTLSGLTGMGSDFINAVLNIGQQYRGVETGVNRGYPTGFTDALGSFGNYAGYSGASAPGYDWGSTVGNLATLWSLPLLTGKGYGTSKSSGASKNIWSRPWS
jgi:hypothetical protein